VEIIGVVFKIPPQHVETLWKKSRNLIRIGGTCGYYVATNDQRKTKKNHF